MPPQAPPLSRLRGTPTATRMGAAGLVVMSSLSAQVGAAYAFGLFRLTSPTMAAWLRNLVGAGVLMGLMLARRGSWRRLNVRAAVAMGMVLGGMNATFYEGLMRLPLGDGVAIEFTGPIVVAALSARSRRHLAWVALATAGVLAISRPGPSHLNYLGMLFMLMAATFWGVYILVGRRIATSTRTADTLAMSMAFSALFLTLPALVRSAATLSDPRVLGLGVLVGVVSSAIPYSIELVAMGRVPPAIFGVLLSLQPLSAALVGLVLLKQEVSALELIGFLLVVTASLGVTFSKAPRAAEVEGELLAT